jgi:hypothetical protein
VNTGTTVFKEGTKYYAVDQGVWYEADSPNGPWQVSVNPPQEVNKIPPSNPHYNAKYVKVYESTDDKAYVGYTPGYTGSYVDNGTVVYGTGYNYPAYSTANTYIPPAVPATYGYAATYDPYESTWGYQPSYYNPLSWLGPSLIGFGLGYATGVATSNWWNRNWYGGGWYGGGWWGSGGYNYTNVNITHNYVYNRPWNPGNRWPGYRPGERPEWKPGERPGRPGRPGLKPGRPSQLPSNIYKRPWNENRLASRPGRPTATPVSAVRPTRPGAGPERPQARPRPETRPNRPQARPAGGKNNVFADRSGNVYRRDARGNWQQRQGNKWTKAQAAARPATRPSRPSGVSRPTPRPSQPTARPTSFNANRMNREFQARQQGQARTRNFQRAQSSPAVRPSRPSGGGGGISRPAGGGGGGPRGGGGRSGGGGGRRR